jgi:adenine-specific DNA methylase
MSHNESNLHDQSERRRLAIEGKLPLKAVGIENLKEANPQHMPPHRYLHPWFARRPTPASRLAVLASVLPEGVDANDLLRWMQIGPPEGTGGKSLVEYVADKKSREDDRDGTLQDHYGYPRPFTQSPSKSEREEIHELLRNHWDGELPTVLDPTAGGGVIPFEALRYDLPTIANELNPIPSLMLKTMNEYAPEVGSIKSELNKWSDAINEIATERLEEYFPSEADRQTPSHYACTYTVTCPDCGFEIPLVKKWWLQKKSATSGVAARPYLDESTKSIRYDCVRLPDDISKEDFDPQDGPHSRSGAECLNCPVVMESDNIRQAFHDGEYESTIYGVKYTSDSSGSGWRAPSKEDHEACEKAYERTQSDFRLNTILTADRYIGDEDRAGPYGVTEWRDAFTARQLVTHYEYLRAFEEVKDEIRSAHSEQEAEAIRTSLALVSSKAIDRNTRFAPLDTGKGYPANALGGKHFTLQWSFVDNNLCSGNQSWRDNFNRVRDSYESLVSYLEDVDDPDSTVLVGDAADMDIEDGSVQAVVIDPPYYDSIIYSELSDICYVWLKEYLGDTFPEMFTNELSNKQDEAVANVAEYEGVADGSQSKKEFASEDYEEKMAEIFQELYRVIEPGGVMTVMFTHKESSAWDTLTKSLIRSGFTVTSTHPITSEMPQRTDTRGGGSADSTLLLTGRKPTDTSSGNDEQIPTLWNDVRADTRSVAKDAARELLDAGLSLTKTDVIISAFGPTLQVYADAYPVVDNQDQEVPPRRALEEAREAVTRVLVEEYLEGEGLDDLDDITEWYVLSWLVHESDTFHYDDGRQLGLGIGVDIDDIKRSTKIWGKKRGDIQLKTHDDRVQDITLPREERSSRTPVDPDALSYSIALDAVHAAMHVYGKQGEDVAIDWLKERNFDTDAAFKATLKALLQVLPQEHSEWEAVRDLALGRTHDALGLDFTPTDFTDPSGDELKQSELADHSN